MSSQTISGHIPEWDLADRMRKTMREAGTSVQEVAEYFGVNRNTVGTWINGRITPPLSIQRLWAVRFGVPLEWLQTGQAPHEGGPDGGLPHLDSNQKPFDLRMVA